LRWVHLAINNNSRDYPRHHGSQSLDTDAKEGHMTLGAENWRADDAWQGLKKSVKKDHGPLFWWLLCGLRFLRLIPSVGEWICQPRTSKAHVVRHLTEEEWERNKERPCEIGLDDFAKAEERCRREKDMPCEIDLDDFAKAIPATHKLNLKRLDVSQLLNFGGAVVVCIAIWSTISFPMALWGLAWWFLTLASFFALWRIVTIVIDGAAMLWFDDLIDLYYRKDPRVQSFRRLSMQVVGHVIELVLLSSFLYAWAASVWPPTGDYAFGCLLFGSFQSALTLNYVDVLNPVVWVIEVITSLLLIILVLAVAAGERHARAEIARNPGDGWSRYRETRHPFKDDPSPIFDAASAANFAKLLARELRELSHKSESTDVTGVHKGH
jgi:hypothetical protein